MKPMTIVLFFLIGVLSGCIKLDSFLFENEPADNVFASYHDLPLYTGNNPPSWIASGSVEREIYLTPEGTVIPPDQLNAHSEYIHGCFLHAPEHVSNDTSPLAGKNVTFIYTHGNSGNMLKYWYRAVSLWSLGSNVFIFTYRGYGLSKGKTTRFHVKQDALAASKYIRNRSDVDTGRIVVYGYSMGGITASYLAGASPDKNRFAGLILESALDAPAQIANLSAGMDFPNDFIFDKELFDGPQFIQGTTIPVLQIHGGKDSRVLIDQAKHYYNVLNGRANYTHYLGLTDKPDELWLKSAGHRNIPNSVFQAENHISDYWDDASNINHCCVNPFEYDEPQFQDFLKNVGNTNGKFMIQSAQQYRALIADWVKMNLNPKLP